MPTPRPRLPLALVALAAVLLLAAPAAAADLPAAPVWGGYFTSFIEHWKAAFKKQNAIVLFVAGVGVVAIFIITRAPWKK